MHHTKLPPMWEIPAAIRSRYGEQAGRQRAILEEGHLLLILHAVPEPGVPERKGVLFWRTPENVWKTTAAGAGLANLRALVTAYEEAVDAQEAKLLEADSALDLFAILRIATPLLRAIRNQHRSLQSAREGVGDDPVLIAVRDASVQVERAAELLVEEAKLALDIDVAEKAERQAALSDQVAQSTQRLNMLAAVTLPMTAIASALGMNLENGLETAGGPYVFWAVTLSAFGFGFVVRAMITKGF